MYKKTYKTTKSALEVGEEPVKIKTEVKKPIWIIDGEFAGEELEEAHKLLEKGVKPRKVALRLGIHKSKIRRVIK